MIGGLEPKIIHFKNYINFIHSGIAYIIKTKREDNVKNGWIFDL
jgi:hypothetical protein